MARTLLTSGDVASFGVSSSIWDITGTNSNEVVSIQSGADAKFDASFNRGGDTINLAGNAASYTATIVGGSRIVLTGANGTQVDIPVGGVGITLNFDDATGRSLRFNDSGALLLGGQTIATVGDTTIGAGDGPVEPEPGEAIYLTSGNDRGGEFNGTSASDFFYAPLSQNPMIGGVSNSLSSGDRLFGGSGSDSLYAVLIPEFFGALGSNQVDVQPTINSVESIEFEARDLGFSIGGSDSRVGQTIYVDGKDIRGHVAIGSAYSDGDLVIENLTTWNSAGTLARNTDEITITMDHTDNFNSDGDASDLHVYFDDDFLLAGQSRTESQANYFLLDEDSEDYITEPLENIQRNGVSLEIDGTPINIEFAPGASPDFPLIPDTWEGFAAALQTRINQMIATGTTILQGITVTVDYNNTDETFNDFGNLVTIPAITLIDANGRELLPTGFLIPEGASGSFDIFGRFDNEPSEAFDNPIAIDIELHKVGRNGDGGDLIVGGKAGDKGIEVFNVSVLGAGDEDPDGEMTKPSSLGTLASTGGALAEVYIVTDPEFVNGSTWASLEIRDGFGDAFNGSDNPAIPAGSSSLIPNDMRLVDADGFLGDLSLGTSNRIVNLDTLTAQGGGDVVFRGIIDGNEVAQPYSYTTGSGDDYVSVLIDVDGVDFAEEPSDFAQSSVTISTGDGNDEIDVTIAPDSSEDVVNQAILSKVLINAGAGNDMITLNVGTYGDAIINGGSGNDVIYTDGGDDEFDEEEFEPDYAVWAFNFDNANTPSDTEDLQGVQTSARFFGTGSIVRVALSGAGTGNQADGGGVMANLDVNLDGNIGAQGYVDAYETDEAIGSLISGRTFFGDQRDINAAIIRAINEHPRLSTMLVAEMGENNTLLIRSLTSGNFSEDDLEITIIQQAFTNMQNANSILAEARTLTGNSALTMTDIFGSETPAVGATYIGPRAVADTTWYAGLGADAAYQIYSGEESVYETDNVINGGAGDDTIILSTDATPGLMASFTVSSGNALLNGASNETIVVGEDGAKAFGIDYVMNFSVADLGDEDISIEEDIFFADIAGNQGLDFLDFGVYLTSMEDQSVNTNGTTDSNVSNELIDVTLEYNTAASPTVTADANEVLIVRFDATTANSWNGLGNAQIQNLFNNTAATSDFGNFVAANFAANDEYTQADASGTDNLLGTTGSAKAVIMVENADNLGEYKVFELSWNGNAAAAQGGDADGTLNGQVTAVYQGTLDFGTSLDGIHEINLVGSDQHSQLLQMGFGNAIATFG